MTQQFPPNQQYPQNGPYPGPGYYAQPGFPATPPPPPKKSYTWLWVLIGLAVAVLVLRVLVVGGTTDSSSTDSDDTVTSIQPATGAPLETSAGQTTDVIDPLVTDGVYRVGVDIQPGQYRYRARDNDSGYWKTCSDANCQDIIQNDVTGVSGYLTITPDVAYIELDGLNLSPA